MLKAIKPPFYGSHSFEITDFLRLLYRDTVTADTATVTASTNAIAEAAQTPTIDGETFTLTAGVDTLTGTANNDTFTANVAADNTGVANVETLTALDVIDGGAGTDTLNYYTVGATALPAATITNVETINMRSDGAATMNVQNITGVTTVGAYATGADVDIDTKDNVTTVNVTGTAQSIDITDNSTTKILTTVSITGYTDDGANVADDIKIDSTALTSLTVSNSTMVDDGDDIITDSTSSALVMNFDKLSMGAGDVLAAAATGVTVNFSGSTAIDIDDLDIGAATSATLNSTNTKTTTIDGLDVASATTLNLTGSGKIVLTAGTYTALTTFDASTSTGGVTLTAALDNADTFKGGSGNDTLTSVGATTKDHTLGAGDDTVTLTVAALGTSGSIDAGDGTGDKLVMTAANAATASATTGATAFETTISNFEKFEIEAVASAAATTTINMAGLDDMNYLVSNGITADGGTNNAFLAYTNVVTGGTLEVLGDTTEAGDGTTVTVSNAAVATDDTFNIWLNTGVAASAVAAGSITLADVETINFSTLDTGTATGANIAASTHTATLVATSATTVNVSGNNGLNLTNTGNTLIETFDASGVTRDGTDSLSNLGVTFVSDNVTTAVTMTGGEGDDTLTADSASTKANTINGGAGDDTITGALGKDVIDTGAAGSATGDTVDAGAGADKITLGDGKQTVTQNQDDSGVFTVATVTTTGTENYDVIFGATSGDVINLQGAVETDASFEDFNTFDAGAQLTTTTTATKINQWIGTYDAATNVFTSDATGDDLMLAWAYADAGTTADEAIVLVGMGDVLTDAELAAGIITIA